MFRNKVNFSGFPCSGSREQWTLCREQWTLCREQWTLCREQWTLCREQWTLCGEQWTLCGEQWTLCGEQWTLCGEQWTLCREQWTLCRELARTGIEKLCPTETSEHAVNVRRTSRGYAPLFGIHEQWAPAWSSCL